jgi:hypothetical protein
MEPEVDQIENTISECSAIARGVSPIFIPASISGCALSRERFQPVSDRVPGLHQPGHDQSAHRAQSHKPNIHDAYFLAFAGRQGRLSAIGRYWLLELGCQVRVSPLMILSNG